jgi:hypothetical protein
MRSWWLPLPILLSACGGVPVQEGGCVDARDCGRGLTCNPMNGRCVLDAVAGANEVRAAFTCFERDTYLSYDGGFISARFTDQVSFDQMLGCAFSRDTDGTLFMYLQSRRGDGSLLPTLILYTPPPRGAETHWQIPGLARGFLEQREDLSSTAHMYRPIATAISGEVTLFPREDGAIEGLLQASLRAVVRDGGACSSPLDCGSWGAEVDCNAADLTGRAACRWMCERITCPVGETCYVHEDGRNFCVPDALIPEEPPPPPPPVCDPPCGDVSNLCQYVTAEGEQGPLRICPSTSEGNTTCQFQSQDPCGNRCYTCQY